MFRKSCVALFCAALLSPAAPASASSVVERDEYSTTTQLPGGKLKTSVSSQPVNFEASPGVWRAIDTTLEPGADGTVGPAAVDGDVAIPATLSKPVELSHDGHELTVRLRGSSGGRDEVADAGAEFQDALAGVDVAYVSTPRGVKETLRLASASGPKVFSYDVRGAADWTAALDGGDVVLRDASGKERYRITAPLAWDSAPDPAFTNALDLTVAKVSDGRWTLTLRPDAAWLSDPARTMPVFIDPDYSWSNGTTHFHGAQDCYLSGNTQANYTFCAQTYLQTGYYNRPYRSTFKWDIASAIPTNATVSAATFKAYAPPQSAHYSANHSLTAITSDWDSNATWNNRKTATPWTTAGGDLSTNPAYKSTSTAVQASSAWYSWTAPVAAVQGWVNGTLPNYGLLLQTDAGAPANNAYVWASTEASTSSAFPATSAEWPTLDVTWSQGDNVPPPVPLDVSLGTLDQTTGSALLAFTCPDDLAPTAVTPSGTVGCDVQISKNGGSWTAWQLVASSELLIVDLADGDTVDVRLRSRDHDGNTSAVGESALVARAWPDYRDETADAAEFLADEYGYTEVQAEAWLSVHEVVRLGIQELKAAAGATYAGYWFDNADRQVHLQVLSAARSTNIDDSAAFLGLDEGVLEVDEVDRTLEQVTDDASELSDTLQSQIENDLVEISPFDPGSEIILLVADGASSSDRTIVQAAAAAVDIPVYVEELDESLPDSVEQDGCKRTDGLTNCDFPARGGATVLFPSSPARHCTTGFVADKVVPDGQPLSDTAFMLTAGHCAVPSLLSLPFYQLPRDTADDELFDVPAGGTGRLGRVDASYRLRTQKGYDVAAIELLPSVADQIKRPLFRAPKRNSSNAGRSKLVRGVESPAFGSMTCVGGTYGSTCVDVTGTHQGTKQAQFRANTCRTQPGDSGGPANYRGIAQGTHVGKVVLEEDSDYVDGFRNAWARERPGTTRPILARCSNGDRGYAVEMDVEVSERLLGVRVRTAGTQRPVASGGVRVSMTWKTGADVDLHAFYRATPTGPIIHAEWRHPDTISGSHLAIDLVPSNGPETFTEAPPTVRQITFAACHYGISGPNSGPTAIEALVHDPVTGEDEIRRLTLTTQGQGDFFGTSPGGGANVVPPGAWCDTGNTGYPNPSASPDTEPTVPGDS